MLIGAADVDAISQLLTEGIRLNALGRFDMADRTLRRALRTIDRTQPEQADRLRARVLTSLAFTTLARHGKPEALSMLDQARTLARRTGSVHAVTLTDIQEGVIQVVSGDWAAAIRASDRGLRHLEVLSPREQCAAFLNRGLAEVSLNRLGAGRRDIEQALDVARAHGLADQEFKARHNLGCVEFFSGDLPKALELMREADALDVRVSRARARLDRALVLIDAGLVDEAEEMLTAALADAREERLRLDEGEIHLDLARCALLRGDLASARRRSRSAVRAFASRKASDRASYAVLVEATIDLAARSPMGVGVFDAVEAIKGREGTSPQGRLATEVLAEAALRRGDLAAASAMVAQLRRVRSRSTVAALHGSLVQARLSVAEGREEEAARVLRRASRVLRSEQLFSPSLEVRAGLALHGEQLARLDLDLAVRSGSVAGVMAALERWRATSQRVTPIGPPHDPEMAALVADLRHNRVMLASAAGGDPEHLRAEVARLQAEISERDWSRTGHDIATDDPVPVRLSAVHRAIAASPGATLFGFFEFDGHLHRLTITRSTALMERLARVQTVAASGQQARRDVRAAALAPVPELKAAIARAADRSLAHLDRLLFGSRSTVRRSGAVVVIPTRALASVPWSRLPMLRGRPVIVASSVTRWVRAGEAGGSEGGAPFGVAAISGPGLARAADEASAVLHTWAAAEGGVVRARSRLGAAATADVVEALSSARVVHVAAHGIHEDQNPLFSSLRMANGPVFAHEFPTPVRSEHVILSACEVGRSRSKPGDESLGLTAALLSLGARSVVAAVAPVPDDAAEQAMVRYHELLAGGQAASVALAAAVQEVPDAGVFCLFGADWRWTHGTGQTATIASRKSLGKSVVVSPSSSSR